MQNSFECVEGETSEPKDAAEKAFLHCDELPPMADVDVTAAHIEKVAGGGGGQGWYFGNALQDFLLSTQYVVERCLS